MADKTPNVSHWYIEKSKITTEDVFRFRPNVITLTKEQKNELNKRNRQARQKGVKQ